MSSFKRKTSLKESTTPVGTRALSGSATTWVTSTGVPSLDDILGGGLPLSCSLLIHAQDTHSAYGELLQKYFISQGLSSSHNVCVIDSDPAGFASGCMWRAEGAGNETDNRSSDNEDDREEGKADSSTKIQIAWRYEQLRQFQTTVSSPYVGSQCLMLSPTDLTFLWIRTSTPDFCQTFDLTTRVPASVLEDAVSSGQLVYINVDSSSSDLPYTHRVLQKLQDLVAGNRAGSSALRPLRISIPSLGSPQWGDLEPRVSAFQFNVQGDPLSNISCRKSVSSCTHCEGYFGGTHMRWLRYLFLLTHAQTYGGDLAGLRN